MRIEIVTGAVTGGSTLVGFSGSTSLSSGVSTGAGAFSGVMSDTQYSILWSITNVTDVSPILLWGVVTAKSTSGFTATFNAATDTANYVLEWTVVRYV